MGIDKISSIRKISNIKNIIKGKTFKKKTSFDSYLKNFRNININKYIQLII